MEKVRKMKLEDYKEYSELLKSTVIPTGLNEQEVNKRLTPLIAWILNHTPQNLYKFRTCNENNINAFRNKEIWFATGSQMNDDFDALLYCDKEKILRDLNNLFDEEGNLKFLTYLKMVGDVPEIIKERFSKKYVDNANFKLHNASDADIRELSLQIRMFMENGFTNQFPFIAQLEQNLVKFSSFSEDICSPLMWGHYANNSTGFALAYDFRNGQYNECGTCERRGYTCSEPKSNLLFPIIYEDKILNATDFARFSMQHAMTRRLFLNMGAPQPLFEQALATVECSDIFMQTKIILHKSKDWQPEKEWRLSVNYNSPFYLTDKNACVRKSPSALYLGRKIKETDELILRNIAYQQQIPVFKMEIDENSDEYKLVPKEMRNSTEDLILKSLH